MPYAEATMDFVQCHHRSSGMGAVAKTSMPLTEYPTEEVPLEWHS